MLKISVLKVLYHYIRLKIVVTIIKFYIKYRIKSNNNLSYNF